MPTPRLRRVGELIKRELALYFNRHAQSYKPFMITVVGVVPARDLRNATVWVSIYGNEDKRYICLGKLNDAAKTIRFELATAIYLKRMPALLFKLDDSINKAYHIDKTLVSAGQILTANIIRKNGDG